MREIARRLGISKPLLYHYFPSKRAFFEATLAQAAAELRARTEPDPTLPPLDQLRGSSEAFLELIDDNALAYRKLMQSVSSVPEVRELVEEVRTRTAARILEGLYPDGAPPKARAAVHGWLWFMDGACLRLDRAPRSCARRSPQSPARNAARHTHRRGRHATRGIWWRGERGRSRAQGRVALIESPLVPGCDVPVQRSSSSTACSLVFTSDGSAHAVSRAAPLRTVQAPAAAVGQTWYSL